MYITETDLIAEFGEGEVGQLASRDPDAIDAAIIWAEAVATGYLNMARLTVPTPSPRDLRGTLCDMVRWRLYDDALTDVVTLRFNQAMDWLRAVAGGRVIPSWATPPDLGTGDIAYTEPEAIFTVQPSW